MGWVRFGWVRLGWVRLGCIGLGWFILGRVSLGWVRLGCVGLGWIAMVANFDTEKLMLLGYKSTENEPTSEFYTIHFHY